MSVLSVVLVKGARKLDHVERYDVVRPQRLTGRVKRNIFSNQVLAYIPLHTVISL